jgi:hypothetical protein
MNCRFEIVMDMETNVTYKKANRIVDREAAAKYLQFCARQFKNAPAGHDAIQNWILNSVEVAFEIANVFNKDEIHAILLEVFNKKY